MNEPLVAHKQVAAGKGLGTDFAYERLLFGVGADMSLEVFLYSNDLLVFGRGNCFNVFNATAIMNIVTVPAVQRVSDSAGTVGFWICCQIASS